MSALGHCQPLSVSPGEWLLTARSGQSGNVTFAMIGGANSAIIQSRQ